MSSHCSLCFSNEHTECEHRDKPRDVYRYREAWEYRTFKLSLNVKGRRLYICALFIDTVTTHTLSVLFRAATAIYTRADLFQ